MLAMWPLKRKNVKKMWFFIIHSNYFQLFLYGILDYSTYVEMFLRLLGGRIWVSEYNINSFQDDSKKDNSPFQNQWVPQWLSYWITCGFGKENVLIFWLPKTDQKCIPGLKTSSRGLKNISTFLEHHLRAFGSDLKKSWKIIFFSHFPFQAPPSKGFSV